MQTTRSTGGHDFIWNQIYHMKSRMHSELWKNALMGNAYMYSSNTATALREKYLLIAEKTIPAEYWTRMHNSQAVNEDEIILWMQNQKTMNSTRTNVLFAYKPLWFRRLKLVSNAAFIGVLGVSLKMFGKIYFASWLILTSSLRFGIYSLEI